MRSRGSWRDDLRKTPERDRTEAALNEAAGRARGLWVFGGILGRVAVADPARDDSGFGAMRMDGADVMRPAAWGARDRSAKIGFSTGTVPLWLMIEQGFPFGTADWFH